jgi:hypothetical protein
MANSGDPRFLPMLQQLCSDADAVVAEHARWGAEHLARVTAETRLPRS